MRRTNFLARLAACAILFIAIPALVRADTIVLKNGRKIIALSVSVEGDKVRYETPSGSLTLPKSIVDHIETGGSPMASEAASNIAVVQPPLAPPSFSDSDIEQNTLRDGSVDRAFVARLENEARSGTKSAVQAAALAHHVAARFEMGRGDVDHAVEDERTALRYVPEDPALLMNIGYLYLKRSEFKESLEYLQRARRVAPSDPEVSKLSGWAYYGLNKMDSAVAEWKKSLAIRPDDEVEAALKKAERDKLEEENYKENGSRHFTLRYSGAAEPELAKEILRTLEAHYDEISSELSYT
ncbi:MAG TPA: tetratricopeptide repeat protein, partial [Candidatus Acidoferrum sp.]|nr:tetratricopeptide repeat protein [Candidatus Acidoferrum sp.]